MLRHREAGGHLIIVSRGDANTLSDSDMEVTSPFTKTKKRQRKRQRKRKRKRQRQRQSAPTTVNTSHAETEQPKTKKSNLESISYTYQPILKKVVRSFFLLQKRIPTLCLLWTGIRLDLKVLSLLLICVCQSNSISLAQKPLPNPATVTKLTPGFIQETKRL